MTTIRIVRRKIVPAIMTIALTGGMLAIMIPTDAHATETDPVQTGVSASSEPGGGKDSKQPVGSGSESAGIAGNEDGNNAVDGKSSVGVETAANGITSSTGNVNSNAITPDTNGDKPDLSSLSR